VAGVTEAKDGDNNVTRLTCAGAGHVLARLAYQPNGTTRISSQKYRYDLAGRLTETAGGHNRVPHDEDDALGQKTAETPAQGTAFAKATGGQGGIRDADR